MSALTTVFAPRVLSKPTASPSDPFEVVGTATLTEATEFHFGSQYPGADYWLLAQPQTVPAESNGYYVKALFEGTVTRRGYYGGEIGVAGTYGWDVYGYQADAMLAEPGTQTTVSTPTNVVLTLA